MIALKLILCTCCLIIIRTIIFTFLVYIDIYVDSSRLPIYHTTAVANGLCKEYCYESTRDRLGLQLTYPIQLPSNFNLDAIEAYIAGTGARPSFIPVCDSITIVVIDMGLWNYA